MDFNACVVRSSVKHTPTGEAAQQRHEPSLRQGAWQLDLLVWASNAAQGRIGRALVTKLCWKAESEVGPVPLLWPAVAVLAHRHQLNT